MRTVLTIYAVASLFLVLLGFLANRGAQMNRSHVLGTLHRLHAVGVDAVDERTRQFYQGELPEIERELRQTESDTMDFAKFGGVSFVFSILVLIGHSVSQKKAVQQSAGGPAAAPRASV